MSMNHDAVFVTVPTIIAFGVTLLLSLISLSVRTRRRELRMQARLDRNLRSFVTVRAEMVRISPRHARSNWSRAESRRVA